MLGRQLQSFFPKKARAGENQLPEARVVLGKHAPEWAAQAAAPSTQASAVSYVRMSPATGTTLLAVLNGFWPLFVIVGMGIALLWSGALADSP